MSNLTSKALSPVKDRMKSLGMMPEQIEREASFALQIINRDNQLQQCSPNSILEAILNVANIGLTLNPAANECCIIARWNSKAQCKEAVLEPMYQGLIRLAMKEGVIRQMNTQLVHEQDEIIVDAADNVRPVIHKINPLKDRGPMIGVYSISTDLDGYRQVELMNMAQIIEIRNGSDGYMAFKTGKIKSHPWDSNFGEMARKTVIKRLFKYLNRKGDESKLDKAIDLSNQNHGLVEQWQIAKVGRLLETSAYDDEEKAVFEREIEHMGKDDAFALIERLEANQLPNHPGYQDRVGKKQIGKQVADQVGNDKA
jgi:phage RecT family recombinase